MHSFVGLLKREWLEHRSAFVWGPAVVLVIVLLTGMVSILANSHGEVELSVEDRQELSEVLDDEPSEGFGAMEMLAAMALDVAGSTDSELEQKMALLQMATAQPFHLVFIVIALFALLASLYDERKDGSVLFWKSMPVSDSNTVFSKLAFVLWVAPIVTIIAILIAQFMILTLVSLYVEDGMGGRVWALSGFWWQPFRLVAGYLQLGLWMLPICAWLMLVSARAGKAPALWAFAIPWVLVVLETILFDSSVLGSFIGSHLKSWVVLRNTGADISGQTPGLLSGQLWAGVVLAGVFLAGAVHFRRRYKEI